jgi:hypothetical protein
LVAVGSEVDVVSAAADMVSAEVVGTASVEVVDMAADGIDVVAIMDNKKLRQIRT